MRPLSFAGWLSYPTHADADAGRNNKNASSRRQERPHGEKRPNFMLYDKQRSSLTSVMKRTYTTMEKVQII